jgi:hypothetical protein
MNLISTPYQWKPSILENIVTSDLNGSRLLQVVLYGRRWDVGEHGTDRFDLCLFRTHDTALNLREHADARAFEPVHTVKTCKSRLTISEVTVRDLTLDGSDAPTPFRRACCDEGAGAEPTRSDNRFLQQENHPTIRNGGVTLPSSHRNTTTIRKIARRMLSPSLVVIAKKKKWVYVRQGAAELSRRWQGEF